MSPYDKLLAQLHAMTDAAERQVRKRGRHDQARRPPEEPPASKHARKKTQHRRAKHRKGHRG